MLAWVRFRCVLCQIILHLKRCFKWRCRLSSQLRFLGVSVGSVPRRGSRVEVSSQFPEDVLGGGVCSVPRRGVLGGGVG